MIEKRLVYTTRLDRRAHYCYRIEHVDNAGGPKPDGWIARRHYLPPSPKGYQWTPGEAVVMVKWTAAGWMATAIEGTLEGLGKHGNRRCATVRWSNGVGISAIVPLQRIRPLWLVKG